MRNPLRGPLPFRRLANDRGRVSGWSFLDPVERDGRRRSRGRREGGRPNADGRSRKPAPLAPLRRRVDNMALRWHARLDSPFADRSLPFILAGAVFVILAAMALAQTRSLQPSESLARYSQAAVQVHAGDGSAITYVPPGVAAPQSISHLDGSLLLYPAGWLVGFLPVREGLVLLQALALSWAVLPLWRLARRVANLRVGATSALIVAYALYPPLHAMNSGGFHPLVLAVPLLLVLVQRALSGSILRLGLVSILVLTLSAELALVLVGVGVMLALTVRRRAGIGLALMGALGCLAAQTVSWYGAGDDVFIDGVAHPSGARTALAVLVDAVVNPTAALEQLGDRRVLVVVASLLLPVALLSVYSLRYLLAVVPLQLAYLLSDLPGGELLGVRAAVPMVFVFAAATFALARLGRSGGDRISVPPRLSGALVGVAVLFFVLDAAPSPYERPWDWGSRDAADGIRLQWTDEVIEGPDPAPIVAATADMAPLLTAAGITTCALPAERYDCPAPPTLYLVDRRLDPRTPNRADLLEVRTEAGGRLSLLRPR
ncbi:MAG: DUF2079 domain-containing protein [Acidimicrobiales bacterium]